MHFLTSSECDEWDALRPRLGALHAKAAIPRDFTASLRFCQAVERAMRPYRACLLWFTETDIWPSSTNWHLYYRLRLSYGDHRRVEDAPGHVFLDDEVADLVSFLQIAMLAGFDAHLITDPTGSSRAFLSHDEFVEFYAGEGNEELVNEFLSLIDPP
jgi:hypothetical protein